MPENAKERKWKVIGMSDSIVCNPKVPINAYLILNAIGGFLCLALDKPKYFFMG